ncbi:MAG: Asp-tRNA(Asn)/Glu-tRNA(Gln) amidotransferase subunit GatB [Acidobacteriota bacterium]
MPNGWETIIGLEVHAQLSTESKIFCSCSTRFGDEPNSNTCPVCLGLPGALPVLNWRAVELGARAALALGLKINQRSIFSRKNYFYPDLPKGYQISQYDQPFSANGVLEIMTADRDEAGHAHDWKPMTVQVTRLHLEEDAGKNVHEGLPDVDRFSYIDLNRAGTPLAEIVTEPDFRSSWQAYDYVNHVRRALTWVGASEADMEKGNLRCEANVSVRRKGEPLGTKVELKNLNSVRFMQRAIEFEVDRHIKTLESGGRLVQETRLWDEKLAETRAMRSKEEAHDYRYFPEPDLPPLVVTEQFIDEVSASLPELPGPRARRFSEQYGLSFSDASQLTSDRALADYYEGAVKASGGNARATANWIRSELLRELESSGLSAEKSPVPATELGALVRLIDEGNISGKQGKDVLVEMFASGKTAAAVVEERGLVQVSDTAEIDRIVDEVIAASPNQLEQYRAGKETLLGFFVGQVMKASKGKANPKVVNERLREKLK